jgi:Asp-tRNA(Asn)/Glu-tRNA(Gln) amidotransferase A subunit family amidase
VLVFDVCAPSHPLMADAARPRLAAFDVATGFPPTSRAVAAVLRDALARLTTVAEVTTAAPAAWDWPAAWQTWGTIMAHDTFAPWNAAARAWLAGLGGVVLPSVDPVLRHAREVQDRLRAAVDVLLLEQDAWVVPVMGIEAFVHQPTGVPIPVDGAPLDYWLATAAFTAPLSLTGHPVVVMPVGSTVAGLPVGLQLVGRRGGDHALLDLAARLAPALGRFYGPAA